MWDSFSKVEPGHGLGSIGYNTLRQHNVRSDMKRFSKTKKNENHAFLIPTMAELERRAPKSRQPKLIPVLQNEFGSIQWEDDTSTSDFQSRNQLTNERLKTDNWSEFENRNNIYHPEGRLLGFNRKAVDIPEIRTNGYDRFLTNVRPSKQGSVLGSDAKTGYNFTGLMRADRYGESAKKSNPTSYNERLSSSRF